MIRAFGEGFFGWLFAVRYKFGGFGNEGGERWFDPERGGIL